MQIEIRIDKDCPEPRVIICAERMTAEVEALVRLLSRETPQMIAGFRQDQVTVLKQEDIIRFYAVAGKIMAMTAQGEYLVRLRLYELEERLDKSCFARISNSEIVNLRQVSGFDLSFAGTICVSLSDGAVTYVSRRYVSRIKQILGI